MSIVNQFRRLLPSSIARSRLKLANSNTSNLKLLRPDVSANYPISRHCAAYEGSGKTTITFLNEDTNNLMVDAYSASGFTLNNGMKVFGPMILFPNAVLSWRIQGIRDIHEDSLTIFKILDPRPDVILIGYGDRALASDNITKAEREIRKENTKNLAKITIAMRIQGLNVECLPTEDAIASFNYLCSENRLVATALIPPEKIKFISVDHEITGRASSTPKDKDIYTTEEKIF